MKTIGLLVWVTAGAAAGCQGPAGPQGEMGLPGAMGAMGLPGKDGRDGMNGAPGAPGSQGAMGLPGKDGVDGMNGADGKDGQSLADALDAVLTHVLPNKRGIIQILCQSDDGGTYAGSGVRVPQGILTAHHVVEGMVSCAYFAEREPLGSGGAFRQVGIRDVAIIEDVQWIAIDIPTFAVPVLNHTPEVGDLVLVAGHPAGLRDAQFTFGYVTGFKNEGLPAGAPAGYWSSAWQHDAVTTGGSSGGPIFDAQGRIVGLMVGGYEKLDLGTALTLLSL